MNASALVKIAITFVIACTIGLIGVAVYLSNHSPDKIPTIIESRPDSQQLAPIPRPMDTIAAQNPATSQLPTIEMPEGNEEWLRSVPAELHYKRLRIEQEANAWFYFSDAIQHVVKPSERISGKLDSIKEAGLPKDVADPDLDEYLQQNQQALALVDKALNTEICQLPTSETKIDMSVCRQIAEMKLYLAGKCAARGDLDAAATHLLDLLKIGDWFTSGSVDVLNSMIGLIYQEFALNGIRILIGNPKCSEQLLKSMLKAIQYRFDARKAIGNMLRAEFSDSFLAMLRTMMTKNHGRFQELKEFKEFAKSMTHDPDVLSRLAQLDIEMGELLDIRKTIELATPFFRRLLVLADGPWVDQDIQLTQAVEMLAEDAKSTLLKLSKSPAVANEMRRLEVANALNNIIGKVIFKMYIMSIIRCQGAPIYGIANRNVTEILIGMRIFKNRHSSIPTTLKELVDDGILETLPHDPFSDQDFRFDSVEKALRSAGELGDRKPEEKKIFVWKIDF